MKYLLHADGALPNLALMRLGSYFRERGETVAMIRPGDRRLWNEPGEIFGSSIFAFSAAARVRAEREWGAITWGGTGVRIESSLAEVAADVDWDSVRPDYSFYPREDRSIGFTQRGCRQRCSFCVVPKKEGRPRTVNTIAQIWRGSGWPKKILLLDNDFFGVPEWRDHVTELREGDYRVCFSQGINIRQVDDEAAAALASIEYRDNEFTRRRLYTAWDNLGDERVFKAGVETLRRAGIPPAHLIVYMLVGFAPGETFEQIRHRFDEMVTLGCKPYPMVYDRSRGDLKAFQRWAVTGLYRAVSWEAYSDPRKLETTRP